MTSALISEEIARLIFFAHNPSSVNKLKHLLSDNKLILESLSEPIKSSIEAAIYDTDRIQFSVYGDRGWNWGF